MKKTIFKGTVNGETFTDVQAYNKRVTELLANGECISAETSTETVDVEEAPAHACACEEIVPDTMVALEVLTPIALWLELLLSVLTF